MANLGDYGGADADSVLTRSASVWQAARRAADSMDALPDSSLNLHGILSRVPKLPDAIASNCKKIQGFSTWENIAGSCVLTQKDERILEISLRKRFPANYGISPEGFIKWPGTRNNGVALLVLGWAYVLNASLAERQNLCIEYQTPVYPLAHTNTLPICLEYSSPQELAWWAGVTADRWNIAGKQVFPWSVEGLEMRLEILGNIDTTQPPPTAEQAAQYLARFCQAFNLGGQCTAALAAALCLPLHSSRAVLKPARIDLPRPRLEWLVTAPDDQDPPPDFQFLAHYMVFSLSPWILGPCLWSVFWDPDVPCNLAGAWTGPIATVLKPLIEENNLELLAKVLSFTSAAPMWLGITLTGKNTIIKSILPFLTQGRKYPDAHPNIDAAAWFGWPQSFLNLQSAEPTIENGEVSRAHVWRLRHDFHFEYHEADHSYTPPYGWPPFGKMRVEDVELEIRSHLQCSHNWSYNHWTWLPDGTTDKGFLGDHRPTTVPRKPPVPQVQFNTTPARGENIQKVSKAATEAIFWWCCDQVEEGFGNGKLVPPPSNLGGSSRSSSPTQIDHDVIERWITQVMETTDQA